MTSKLDSALTLKAVTALFEYEDKQLRIKGKESLIGIRSKPILAQVQLKEVIRKPVLRPVRVKIPNSLLSDAEDDSSVCLFCKSEEKKALEDYISSNPIAGLTKVVSVNDVRKCYSALKDRKKLLSEHTHFICEPSVLTQVYKLLGKPFAEKNNCPVPVTFKSPDKLQQAMMKVLSSSYMHMKGQTITITVGLTTMNEDHVTANTLEGLEFAVAKFKGVWKDVHSIHLKTSDSPALPIYSKLPSEVLKYVKKQANIEEVKIVAKIGKAPARKPNAQFSVNPALICKRNDENVIVDGSKSAISTTKMKGAQKKPELPVEVRSKFIKRIKSSVLKRC